MFSLSEQKAKLSNVNIRAELHGEATKIAVDLKIEIKVANDVLSEFDPSLKSALYRAIDVADHQGDLLAAEPGYLPKLKFPAMAPIKWDWSGAGYAAIVHYGVSGKDDIVMLQTEVDQIRFDCQDGGTVAVCMRVIAHPKSEEIGRLSEMVQQEITISLEAPSAEEQLKAELAAMGDEDDE